jgi:hypothetical protein
MPRHEDSGHSAEGAASEALKHTLDCEQNKQSAEKP